MNTNLLKLAVFLGSISLSISSVTAQQELGISFNNGETLGPSEWTLGYEFQVISGITVDGLATCELSSLPNDVPVGLWGSDGSLIASATVVAGTPVIAGTQFAEVGIAPIYLVPGYYVVGSYDPGNDYTGIGAFTGLTVAPGINYVTDEYVYNSFSDPTTSEGYNSSSAGWFGGNIVIGAAPEPSSFWLLLAGGTLALGAWRRRSA